jgi:MFS family permease
MLAGNICETIGRKQGIILSDVLAIIGPLIQYFASTVSALCFGRLLLGFGMGISMMVSQVYLSESSPIALRGQIVPSYFFGVFFAFILAHTCSLVFAYNLPLMFGLGLAPNLLQLILMLTTQKESPSYLA